MIATPHPPNTHGNVEFDLKVVGLGPTPQCEAAVQTKGYTAVVRPRPHQCAPKSRKHKDRNL